MTSRYEGFPLVAVESMRLALPFIGFEIPSLQEVTANGKYGKLVELGDVQKMADILNRLSKSEDEKHALSKQSLARVKEFTVKKIGNEWSEKVIEI